MSPAITNANTSAIANIANTNTNASGKAASVDPAILKKLHASVMHFHGRRTNLQYVISVATLTRNKRCKDRDSTQFVTRSYKEFRAFRKSLLRRVGSIVEPTDVLLKTHKCHCKGEHGCVFDVTRPFLERLRFSRLPLLSLSTSEQAIRRHRMEMNNFLRVVFALVHRSRSSACDSECLFLHDILAFLDVEQTFSEQVEQYLQLKHQQLSLTGWKAHTRETYGTGIRAH